MQLAFLLGQHLFLIYRQVPNVAAILNQFNLFLPSALEQFGGPAWPDAAAAVICYGWREASLWRQSHRLALMRGAAQWWSPAEMTLAPAWPSAPLPDPSTRGCSIAH